MVMLLIVLKVLYVRIINPFRDCEQVVVEVKTRELP